MADKPKSELASKLGELVEQEMLSAIKKTDGATVSLLESIDNSLSDLVDVLEKNGGEAIARSIVAAIEKMSPMSGGSASPTIEVHPAEVHMPAPVVHVQPATEAVFDIKFDYGPNGRLLGMKVVRGIK